MEILYSAKPLYALLVPLVAVPLIGLSRRAPNLRESWTILASTVQCLLVASMIPAILGGRILEFHLITILPGLSLAFRVDPLGILFAMTASMLWIFTSIYSIGYMRSLKEQHQTRYFIFFALALSATLGIAFSANVFTLFLFYEALTLSTYPLVVHRQTPETRRAGRRYLVYLLGTSIAFQLFAIFLTYQAVGTLRFTQGGILIGMDSRGLLSLIFILFIAGTTKAALIPLHSWLPAAMVAPTPVSALLHAVAVVKAGVFTILKIVFEIFGLNLLHETRLAFTLTCLASFTVIAASVVALRQDDLKLRLAYSTVSQLALVLFGAALLTPGGIMGSAMQMVTHAFGKITLFLCAGAMDVAAHRTRVSELDGIGHQMPWTMAAFTIGSLSLIGVPPTGGFISKWYLITGTLEADQRLFVSVIIAGTILTAAYLLPVLYRAFFREPPSGKTPKIHEAPPSMLIPVLLTTFGTIVLIFWPSVYLLLARLVVFFTA